MLIAAMSFKIDRCTFSQLLIDDQKLTIPAYQREYDWGARQFEAMWSDLLSHLRARGDYFMGPINAERLPRALGGGLELADGQQRLTTLYIILAAASRFVRASQRKRIEKVLRYQRQPRIIDQTPGSVLRRVLAQSKEFNAEEARELKQCFAFNFYFRKLKKKKLLEVQMLVELILTRIVFARVVSTEPGSGMRMFERSNTRGLPLTLCDKVKSLIIGSASPTDVEEVKATWGKVVRDLRSAQRFDDSTLQSWLAAEYEDSGERPDVGTAYEIIERRVSKTSALAVCKQLASYSNAVVHIYKGRTPKGNKLNGSLQNLKVFGRYRQLLTILHAAYRLDEERFGKLAEEIENTICVVGIAKAKPNYVEKHIPKLLLNLRTADRKQRSYQAVLEGLKKLRNQFAKDFGEVIVNEPFDDLRRDHRQMLWHLLQEHFARKFEERTRKPRRARDASARVSEEHIIPKARSASKARREYGDRASMDIHRFANLTPLEPNPNKGTKPYSEKKSSYGDSSFWITTSMHRSPARTKRFRAEVKEYLPKYQVWNHSQLKRRADRLHRLSSLVLNFDMQRVPFREWD